MITLIGLDGTMIEIGLEKKGGEIIWKWKR